MVQTVLPLIDRMSSRLCGILLFTLVWAVNGAGEKPCGISADIAFLLDSSIHIHGDDFATEKQFVKDLVGMFDVGPERTRVSVLLYAERVIIDSYLDQFDNGDDISHRLDKLQQPSNGGQTQTDLAIEATRTQLLDPDHGARLNVPRICILLSGGASDQPRRTQKEARLAKDAGIILLAVGVGKVSIREMEELVSAPADENTFYAETFTDLKDVGFLRLVGERACKAAADEWTLSSSNTWTSSPDKSESKPGDSTWTSKPDDSLWTSTAGYVWTPTLGDSRTSTSAYPTWTSTPVDSLWTSTWTPTPVCQGKEADVVFVLDMSSSIWSVHFQEQLEFVTNVIDTFDVDSGKTQVAAVVYSNNASIVFDLDKYRDNKDIAAAVLAIKSDGGTTNTHKALQLVIDRMFTPQHGSRPGVTRICILITDGRSTAPEMTRILAKKIRDNDIYVFAIGVGNMTDRAELAQLASRPTERYMFEENDYKALTTIRDILAYKACEVMQADQPRCLPGMKTDIVFGLYNISGSQRDSVAEFIKSVGEGYDLDSGDVRIAITESCGNANLPSTGFSNTTALQDTVCEKMSTKVSGLIQSMRRIIGRSPKQFEINRAAVLFVSGKISDMRKAYTESMRLKFFATLVVIGIGEGVDTDQLMKLATHRKKYNPDNSHVLPVIDLSELPLIVKKLHVLMCKGQ